MLELLDFMKFKFRDRKFILCQIENVGNLFKMIRFVSFFCADVVTNDQIRSIFGLLQVAVLILFYLLFPACCIFPFPLQMDSVSLSVLNLLETSFVT